MDKSADTLNLSAQKVTLLFKPGHYDILYDKEYLKKFPALTLYDSQFEPLFNPNLPSAPVASALPQYNMASSSFAPPPAYQNSSPSYRNPPAPYSIPPPAYQNPSSPYKNPPPVYQNIPPAGAQDSAYPSLDDYNPADFQLPVMRPHAPEIQRPAMQPPPSYYQEPNYSASYQSPPPPPPMDYNPYAQRPSQSEYYEDKKDMDDFPCGICASPIKPEDAMTLPCKHKFHKYCFQQMKSKNCPVCQAISESVACPIKKPQLSADVQCEICKKPINDVKKDAANHCTRGTGKMHKECFENVITDLTDAKVLLTKTEDNTYHRVCPVCHEYISEDSVKKNLPADRFKIFKQNRDERDKEEKKKIRIYNFN